MKEMVISTPARRYAHALMEISIKQRSFTKVLEELELFQRQTVDTPQLGQLLLNPAVPREMKERVLTDVGGKLKLQELTMNFLKLSIRRDRLNLLSEILESAERQFLERQGILVVEVTTARKLDADEQTVLAAKLESFTGKKVQLENRIDPALIGGAVTRIGTTLYDGSVQAQLEQLKDKIIQS